jgi:hypothetical protein
MTMGDDNYYSDGSPVKFPAEAEPGSEEAGSGEDTLASLTREAIDANLAGDKERANELFATRDALARSLYPAHGEEQPTGTTRVTGGEGGDDLPSVADIEDELRGTARGALLVDEWGNDFGVKVRRAIAFIMDDETLRQKFVKAPDHAKADLLHVAERHAREAGVEPIKLNAAPRAPDVRPTDIMAAKRELAALLSEYPPGSRAYLDPYVQGEVRRLNERIHGGGPIVGQAMRTA